jgi:myo-inositol-1(or 4)-monophosphatase
VAFNDLSHLPERLRWTGFPPDLRGQERTLEWWRYFSLHARSLRRTGSTALNMAYVAAGRFDGFWEQHLSAWDIAAGTLLIREAGGVITDFSGRDIGIEHTGVVAGNPAMHDWLLATLNSPQ